MRESERIFCRKAFETEHTANERRRVSTLTKCKFALTAARMNGTAKWSEAMSKRISKILQHTMYTYSLSQPPMESAHWAQNRFAQTVWNSRGEQIFERTYPKIVRRTHSCSLSLSHTLSLGRLLEHRYVFFFAAALSLHFLVWVKWKWRNGKFVKTAAQAVDEIFKWIGCSRRAENCEIKHTR